MRANLIRQLKADEGTKKDSNGLHVIYRCTAGARTIGYGHNLDASGETYQTLTDEEAEALLNTDIDKVERQLQAVLPWVFDLDDARLGVIMNMTFNMGIGTMQTFKNTLAFIQKGDYEKAARNMEKSAWYSQVGNRAKRLVRQMELGEWQFS